MFSPLTIFIILVFLSFLLAWSTVSRENGRPPPLAPVPSQRLDEVRAVLHHLACPIWYQRNLDQTVKSHGQALDIIRLLSPENASDIECWTEEDGFFLVSIHHSGAGSRYYRSFFFIKDGGSQLCYYPLGGYGGQELELGREGE